MYSIDLHASMVGNHPRTGSYAEALARAVKAGDVVVDIGSGTGILAAIACRHGARRVYAIEVDDVIQLAREIAAENGFAEKVTFIQGDAAQVHLPERADIVVFDLRGALPWMGNPAPVIRRARDQFLRPGGLLIPQQDTCWLACVQAEDAYNECVETWRSKQYGIDLTPGLRYGLSQFIRRVFKPEQLLSDASAWASLEYAKLDTMDVDANVCCRFTRAGTCHGFIVWFDCVLVPGVSFATGPSDRPTVYNQTYFPWQEPVQVASGDRAEIHVRTRSVGGKFIWQWESSIFDGSTSALRRSFRQSTLLLHPISLERIRRRSNSFHPELNDAGKVQRFILSAMTDGRTVGEIATMTAEAFPEQFSSAQEAMALVADVSETFSV